MKKNDWYAAGAVVVFTLVCGLIYTGLQQAARQGANEIPVQMAERLTAKLENGEDVIWDNSPKEISRETSPFTVVFDKNGQAVAGDAVLDGDKLTLPTGVFAYADSHGEDRVTWQPRSGVRVAAVVKKYSGETGTGYVLAGQPLRETERRIDWLTTMTGIVYLTGLAVIGGTVAASRLAQANK